MNETKQYGSSLILAEWNKDSFWDAYQKLSKQYEATKKELVKSNVKLGICRWAFFAPLNDPLANPKDRVGEITWRASGEEIEIVKK